MSTGRRRLGKYELYERLGRGGMAEVWKALDIQLERYVAIKVLHADLQNDPDFMKRFIREAQVVASLHHPNIVQVHDFQISPPESGNTTAYMVMDYIQGQTLTEYIRGTSRVGNFPPADEIVYLFSCISSAIDYAHQRGMLHRDIKPSNILLDKRNPSRYQGGKPILTDFGIVKLLGASSSTLSGWWLGTPLYISPEQAQGQPGNERSDIYSLGVILYEMCTGVRPFQGDSPVSIFMQHISAMPTPPALINPRITPALEEVIMRGLAKDPAARFPSASSLTSALSHAFNMSTPANPNPPSNSASGKIGSTQLNSAPPEPPTKITPPSPTSALPVLGASLSSSPIISSNGGQNTSTPTTPARDISGLIPAANFPGTEPSQLPLDLSTLPASRKRRKGPFFAFIALLILILVGSSLGTFYFLSHQGPTVTTAPPTVGSVTFISSGPLSESNIEGIDDTLVIDLHNIPNPDTGKSYYGWLLTDNNSNRAKPCAPLITMAPISLGTLSVNHGDIHFLYPGNQQHINLIGIISGLLITEESTTSTPRSPSADKLYYAELPQTSDYTSQSPTSTLDHLRCLLAGNVNLTSQGIKVGLETQFYRNVKSVWEWAVSAKNSSSPDFIHDRVVRILDYLDGATPVQKDGLSNTPLLVDSTLAQIPLLDLVYGQDPSSFLIRIGNHLGGIIKDPDPKVTTEMRLLATNANQGLNNVLIWLGEVHRYAKQLVKLSNEQLLQASSSFTLNEMETEATYAYSGQIDSSNNKVLFGAQQIDQSIQQMAMFNVKAYPAH